MSDKKHIWYITYCRIPSEKAHGVYAMKHCESLARAGATVTLVLPKRAQRASGDPFTYYKVEKNFRIVYLPVVQLFLLPFAHRLTYRIDLFVFSCVATMYAVLKAPRDVVVCSNEFLCALVASCTSRKVLLEIHDYLDPTRRVYQWFVRRFRYVLVQTKWKQEHVVKDFGLDPERVLYVPNGVDIDFFDAVDDTVAARKKLDLPTDTRTCVYTGHLYSWKGVDTLVDAAQYLDGVTILLVGGLPKDVKRYRAKCVATPNVRVVGHRPYTEMPLWQKAADVLVLPNTAREKISVRYTSPMKLFEYMASKRPVVASDIPSLREVLTKDNAILVEPDAPKKLAEGIQYALAHHTESAQRAERAYEQVQEYRWSQRARHVLKFLYAHE